MTQLEQSVVDDPIPPGPEPVPPDPSPEPPIPEPAPEPTPGPDDGAARLTVQPEVVVELRGTVAVLSGVVERAEERARIVEQVASLDSITKVENHLRPPAA
ncbi:MAG TPA: hypothetical protein VFO64_01445 [Gaiellaceae bacterium]|jgi:hypothetical protein|nr:hypothetical protein [Gaiellaceae bacterium]